MPNKSRVAPAGRDAPLPEWLAQGAPTRERPRFDSVVIRGNGVGALVFAARLARSESFAGKVRIAAPRPTENRMLINGCTLRARSLDYYAAAFGTSRSSLIEGLFPSRCAVSESLEQHFSLAREVRPGEFELRPLTRWMGDAGDAHPPVLAYGLRNSHLVGRLAERLEAMGVEFGSELPDSFSACRALASGPRPLIVNGSHLPVSDLPPHPAPERFVVASQVPMRRLEGATLPRNSSQLCMRRRAGAFDAGVFFPFVDPLTPEAELYGIFYRIVRPGPGFDKPRELAAMRNCCEGIGRALGYEPVDADATRGEAMVPCLPWRDVATTREDFLDLHRTYSACAPIITGDGMTRAGLAGWIAAEAVLAGENPARITNQSLKIWRRTNHAFALGMTRLSAPSQLLFRFAPTPVLAGVAGAPDMWAAVA